MRLGVSLHVCMYTFGGVSACAHVSRGTGWGAQEARGGAQAGRASLTAGQSRRRLPAGDLEGVVPGADPHAHAERLPPGVAEGPARELDVFACRETAGVGSCSSGPAPAPRPASSSSRAPHAPAPTPRTLSVPQTEFSQRNVIL